LKNLITSATKSSSYELALLLNSNEIVFGESNYVATHFPLIDSPSLAHELLTYCLDYEIERVFPVRTGELSALLDTKVLFAEFGIEIMIPEPNQEFIYESDFYDINSFSELSSKLLDLGYPNHQFALGKANQHGDLIIIDDEQKDFNQVWSKIESISFVQIGKLFNQVNFDPLIIYPLENGLKQIHVLFSDGSLKCVEILPVELSETIQNILAINKAKGFYQVYLSGEKIIRIKNVAI
jgi:hypothetical protein